jgi:hypothetical protein
MPPTRPGKGNNIFDPHTNHAHCIKQPILQTPPHPLSFEVLLLGQICTSHSGLRKTSGGLSMSIYMVSMPYSHSSALEKEVLSSMALNGKHYPTSPMNPGVQKNSWRISLMIDMYPDYPIITLKRNPEMYIMSLIPFIGNDHRLPDYIQNSIFPQLSAHHFFW